MLFNSFAYLIFLPLVVALYWAAPVRTRRLLLLVASYIFYMSWLPRYGLLIAAITGVNFLFGLWMVAARKKGSVLALALATNLAGLGWIRCITYQIANCKP